MTRLATGTEFLAVIGDVVASRQLPDRAAVQEALAACVDGLAQVLPPGACAAPPALVSGDEIQLLLHLSEAAVAVEALRRIDDSIGVHRLAFGLGWGALSTPLPRSKTIDVARLDGACFHAARSALERAQAQGRWAAAEGTRNSADALVLDGIFALLGHQRAGWTEKQAATVVAARGRLQKDVAADLGVQPSVVSERLKAAGFDAYSAGEHSAELVLRRIAGLVDGAEDER